MDAYRWITTYATPSVVDNQHPNYTSPLFDQWTREGWEIVSVTVLPPTAEHLMCVAIGVLRRPTMTPAEPL